MNFVGGNSLAGGILSVFACGARTSSPMDKRKPQLDSARQIGVETVLTEFLMVGCTDCTGGRKCLRSYYHDVMPHHGAMSPPMIPLLLLGHCIVYVTGNVLYTCF